MIDIVSIQNVAANYQTPLREMEALKDVSFTVKKGEFVSVIGPSGCGKSTLLSIIAGLTKPSQGKVEIHSPDGSPVSVGYMLQRDCLYPWRTIWQNVCLGLEIKKMMSPENTLYAQNLLKTYGLWEFKDSFPRELSGGMRQRAALIRTLAIRPTVLLLDEALGALDYQTRLTVADDLYRIIQNEHMTVVMVTHDISEGISLSDKIIVLSKRPATVKSIHEITFASGRSSPLKCRESPEFGVYFNRIWRDIDAHLQ